MQRLLRTVILCVLSLVLYLTASAGAASEPNYEESYEPIEELFPGPASQIWSTKENRQQVFKTAKRLSDHRSRGEVAKAAEAGKKLVDHLALGLPQEDPKHPFVIGYVGTLCFGANDFEGAERLLERSTRMIRMQKANATQESGDEHSAYEALFVRCLSASQEMLENPDAKPNNNVDHFCRRYPKTVLALAELGSWYVYREELEIAVPVLERAHKYLSHSQLSRTYDCDVTRFLGYAYGAAGRVEKAELLLQDALALSEEIYGESNAVSSWILHYLSLLKWKDGDFVEALDLARKNLPIVRAVYGDDSETAEKWASQIERMELHLADVESTNESR